MNLVSNYIGGISTLGANGIGPSTFDMEDNTFSDMLQKQMDTKIDSAERTLIGNFGIPAGINIENINDAMSVNSSDVDLSITSDLANEPKTGSEIVTMFESLMDNINQPGAKSELFDFAKKHANNAYRQYSRSLVTDVNELVEDIQSIK